jgi:hypothetical protein
MSTEAQCPHSDVHWNLHHAGFSDTNIHYLEVSGQCQICSKKLCFRGMPFGMSPNQPTMALDGSEVRLPFLAEGEDYDGKGMSFTGRMVG